MKNKYSILSMFPQEPSRKGLFTSIRRRIFSKQPLFVLPVLLLILVLVLVFSLFTTYNSKASIAFIGGCQVFPTNNIWNYDVSKLPIYRNSFNYINSFANDNLQAEINKHFAGFPYIIVSGTQPYVPIHFTAYGRESDPGPYPIPPNAPIEHRGDAHTIVLNSTTCTLYEMWHSSPQPDGSWKAGSGAVFDLHSNRLRPVGWGSADATGLPILSGLVRYDEVATGVITHALRFSAPNPQNTFVWPARHSDGLSSNPDSPPEGLRLRLKKSVDISSFSHQDQIILNALKHYGMFLADNDGGYPGLYLSFALDSRWNIKDLSALDNIPASDFEAVDESALQVAPDSGMVSPDSRNLTSVGNLLQTNISTILKDIPVLNRCGIINDDSTEFKKYF